MHVLQAVQRHLPHLLLDSSKAVLAGALVLDALEVRSMELVVVRLLLGSLVDA